MKTSNYILIALFGFVTVSLLVLFISARGHENGENSNFSQKEYPLDSVNVIVADQEIFINIRTSEKNSLKVRYPKDEKKPENVYRVSNDTLFVSKVVYQNDRYIAIEVYVSYLYSLVAKNNVNVYVRDFTFDELEINAEKAYVGFYNSSIGKAVIRADNSEVSMYSTKIKSISGKLENHSKLRSDSKNINKMDLEKDDNSQINLY